MVDLQTLISIAKKHFHIRPAPKSSSWAFLSLVQIGLGWFGLVWAGLGWFRLVWIGLSWFRLVWASLG